MLYGHDLDHLVGYRLYPHQLALGCRRLARNLVLGQQIAEAAAHPEVIREPRAFRAPTSTTWIPSSWPAR